MGVYGKPQGCVRVIVESSGEGHGRLDRVFNTLQRCNRDYTVWDLVHASKTWIVPLRYAKFQSDHFLQLAT